MKRSFFETAVNEVLACAPRCTTRVFKAFDVSKILFETDISEEARADKSLVEVKIKVSSHQLRSFYQIS